MWGRTHVYLRVEDLDTGRWAKKTCVDAQYRGADFFDGEQYTIGLFVVGLKRSTILRQPLG